jgi:hypothetical protein
MCWKTFVWRIADFAQKSAIRYTHVHHHHDPEALEQNRFAAKEVDAPQAVLGVPEHSEPRRPTTWQRSIVLDEYASDDFLIDTERARYLLGDLPPAEAGVESFHLDNRFDEFS